jgi:hypothetical protein
MHRLLQTKNTILALKTPNRQNLMKQFTMFMLLTMFSLKAFSQDETAIELKTQATFILTKIANGQYDYKVAEIKKFDEKADITGDKLLRDKVDSNQVRLYFFRGNFGGSKKTLLIIKSGLKVALKYNARIKIAGEDQFRPTDVEPLFPNVKSLEEWPANVIEIILEDFTLTNQAM